MNDIKNIALNAAKAIVAAAVAAALPILTDAINDIAAAAIALIVAGVSVYLVPNKEL